MRGRDEVVMKGFGPALGRFEDRDERPADLWRGASLHAGSGFQPLAGRAPQRLDVGADPVQEDRHDPSLLAEQGVEKMFGRDLWVPVLIRFRPGGLESLLRFDGHFFEFHEG